MTEKVVIESRQKAKNPTIMIKNDDGEVLKVYDLPVHAHIMVEEGARLKAGDVIAVDYIEEEEDK